MIISVGVDIHPQEIESVLVLHPAIADVAAIGIPDPDMGEQVKAKVNCCHPCSIDFVHDVPRSQTGKLMKQELGSRYWSEKAA